MPVLSGLLGRIPDLSHQQRVMGPLQLGDAGLGRLALLDEIGQPACEQVISNRI
jgi:hypothetical protein